MVRKKALISGRGRALVRRIGRRSGRGGRLGWGEGSVSLAWTGGFEVKVMDWEIVS